MSGHPIARTGSLLILLAWALCASAGATQPTPRVHPMPGWPKDEAFDGTLAEVGERLFVERGCVRCHTIGHGRKVGPDLAGVTGRDGPAWVIAMMLDPAEMRAHDLRAMGLKRSYHANMANRHLTPDEARAIAEYFLGKDRGLLPERR